MVWVKIDDRFFHNPKIRQAGQNGREMYLAGLTYCNANLTDGFIPAAEVAYIAGWSQTTAIEGTVALLVSLNLWEAVEDGYLVHDFLEYNPSKAEVEKTREERARVGAIGGKHSAEKRWGSKQTDKQNGNQSDKQKDKQKSNPVSRSPYPIIPVPDSPNIIVADSIADEAQAEPEPQFSEDSEPHRLASLLRSLILSNNPTARLRTQTPKQFATWCAEIDRMLRRDGRDPSHVEAVIRWAQSDPFWMANILSPPKLREKYDTLWLQMQRPSKEVNGNGKNRHTGDTDGDLSRFERFDHM